MIIQGKLDSGIYTLKNSVTYSKLDLIYIFFQLRFFFSQPIKTLSLN